MADAIGEKYRAGSDRVGLDRFLRAQAGVYEQACRELRTGKKRTHWMWFIFPQIRGLGSSEMAAKYAISSIEEARAYLAHPILGPRVRECAGIVVGLEGKTIEQIFGYPDNLKFHSSMTLFFKAAEISEHDLVFSRALEKYFDGTEDAATLQRL